MCLREERNSTYLTHNVDSSSFNLEISSSRNDSVTCTYMRMQVRRQHEADLPWPPAAQEALRGREPEAAGEPLPRQGTAQETVGR